MIGAIKPVPSQNFQVKYQNNIFVIDLDSGATVSFMRLDVAKRLALSLLPNGQLALLADKVSQMKSLGEINILVTEIETGKIVLRLRALIVENLGVECYGGQTFHLDNGIVDNVSMKSISFHHGKYNIDQGHKYGQLTAYPPPYLTVESEKPKLAIIQTQPDPPQDQNNCNQRSQDSFACWMLCIKCRESST